MPSSLIDALFCKIEAHAGHGDQADPAKHLERDRCIVCTVIRLTKRLFFLLGFGERTMLLGLFILVGDIG